MHILSEHRRAKFDYAILKTFEAGIELLGTEVKSVKESRMNLAGTYVHVRGGEAWLLNADIPAYQPKNAPKDYVPLRSRRLLLRKEEIRSLEGKLHEKGLSLIPLKAYLKRGIIKLEIGLVRNKKTRDKRETLKKAAHLREMRREE